MTARISRQHWRHITLITLVTGILLVTVGFAMLPVTLAQTSDDPTPQPTRFGSIFDSAAPATSVPASPAVADEAVDAEEETTATATATTERPTATVQTQPTRFGSIFDASGSSTSGQAVQATVAPTVAEPDAQPTRFGSIFDAPPSGGQAAQATVAPASGQPAAQPTRLQSIFDAPPSGGQTGGPAQQPTRMGSIFDTAGGAPTPPPPGAPGGGLTSIFDTAQADVIRFGGSEAPDADYCLSCHASEFLSMELPNGEVISVTVDEEEYFNSVHGQHGTQGYRCVRCHVGMNEYPHPEVSAQSSRELSLELSNSCATCHVAEFTESRSDLHVDVLARGNINGATCADCHGSHDVQRLTDEITKEMLPGAAAESAQMCSTCHAEVYASYAESVHGQSVLTGNNDAATCSDCHGTHDTQGPSTGPFLLFSPQTCATCHADEALMAKYDINTHVFDTYLSDFHGSTVAIFQQTAPGQPFNEPVCADCHGVHNIMAVESVDSPVLKENLVITCQRCHPDASDNFPAAWMSHYPPSLERTPIVTVANLAYTILIPAVIGSMALFVAADARRRRRDQRHDERSDDHEEE